jgi:hypothetical protein
VTPQSNEFAGEVFRFQVLAARAEAAVLRDRLHDLFDDLGASHLSLFLVLVGALSELMAAAPMEFRAPLGECIAEALADGAD